MTVVTGKIPLCDNLLVFCRSCISLWLCVVNVLINVPLYLVMEVYLLSMILYTHLEFAGIIIVIS